MYSSTLLDPSHLSTLLLTTYLYLGRQAAVDWDPILSVAARTARLPGSRLHLDRVRARVRLE